MNIFERLFRNTLRPTERELLEAEAAWWKDSAKHWREAFREEANRRFALLDILIDIRDQGLNSKSGTARSMANKANEALKS